jgi:general secretion pathway protein G
MSKRCFHGLSQAVAVISALVAIDFCSVTKPTRYICRRTPEKSDILILDHACPLFEAHLGRMPVSLDELIHSPEDADEKAKWAGPYVDKINVDPWGHPYRCEGDGKSKPRIWSLGPDGINGTADDVSND